MISKKKKKKKKDLHQTSVSFHHQLWVGSRKKFSGPNNSKFFTASVPQSRRGAVFILGAKIGFKATKNVLFCILFRPMGGYGSPRPSPLGCATEWSCFARGHNDAEIGPGNSLHTLICYNQYIEEFELT